MEERESSSISVIIEPKSDKELKAARTTMPALRGG